MGCPNLQTGVAAGTVYLYFQDKEALYVELFEEKIRELIHFIRQQTALEQKAAGACASSIAPTSCSIRKPPMRS